MTSYRVYLTKSAEVARIIAASYEIGKDGVKHVSRGAAELSPEVPDVYKHDRYYCCVVEYEDETQDRSEYDLIIA